MAPQTDPQPHSDASAPRQPAPGFYPFRIGARRLISLHDGTLQRDMPPGFVPGVPDETVAAAYGEAGMDPAKLSITFTALAVEAEDGLILIDTGFGETGPASAGHLKRNLVAAGYGPGDVSTILISHFHGDHISGLLDAQGAPAYPGARVMAPRAEWEFWMDEARAAAAPAHQKGHFDNARRILAPFRDDIILFGPDEEILPGITTEALHGHTPGQTGFHIRSGGESLFYVADLTNMPLVFARFPDWKAAFDMDPDQTVATRRRVLTRAAAERQRLFFFHAPFPAMGCVYAAGDGYAFQPHFWTGTGD